MIVVWAQAAFKGPEQAEGGIHMKALLKLHVKRKQIRQNLNIQATLSLL